MLYALAVAMLLSQQPQERRATQLEAVEVYGHRIDVPHLPSSTEQARKEYGNVRKTLVESIRDIERDLADRYGKTSFERFYGRLTLPEDKSERPEAVFLASILNDSTIEDYLAVLIDKWNNWTATLFDQGLVGPVRTQSEALARDGFQEFEVKSEVDPFREAINFLGASYRVGPLVLPEPHISPADTPSRDHGAQLEGKPLELDQSIKDQIAKSRAHMVKSKQFWAENAARREYIQLINYIPPYPNPSGGQPKQPERYHPISSPGTLFVGGDQVVTILTPPDEVFARRVGYQREQAIIALVAFPEIAEEWEMFSGYLKNRLQGFAYLETDGFALSDPDIRRLYDVASVVFLEQLKTTLWLSQNIWAMMSSDQQMPAPLSRQMPANWDLPELDEEGMDYEGGPSDVIVTEIPFVEKSFDDYDEDDFDDWPTGPKLVAIRKAQPVYRPRPGDPLEQAIVEVRISIAMDGTVKDAEYLSGPEYMREASLKAAKLYRYRPLMDSGFAFEQRMIIRFHLGLE